MTVIVTHSLISVRVTMNVCNVIIMLFFIIIMYIHDEMFKNNFISFLMMAGFPVNM